MKKLLAVSFFLFAISCEDSGDDDETRLDLTGTYKLNKDSQDCDGLEDIIWLTIEKNTEANSRVRLWDYMGDECDDDEACYETDEVMNFATKANELSFADDGETIKITGNAGAGGQITVSFSDGTDSFTQKYDFFESTVETFSPVCN